MAVLIKQLQFPNQFSVSISSMNTKYKILNTSSKRGAVLLMAVMMASIMLSVGLGVYQRTYKQLVFASYWKQTQIAFAAADGGLECALYWDLHPASGSVYFATSTSSTLPASNQISCFTLNNSITGTLITTTLGVSTFSSTSSGGCVNVTVTKPYTDLVAPFTTYSTRIESRGYNVSCTVLNAGTNPRVVERALSINY